MDYNVTKTNLSCNKKNEWLFMPLGYYTVDIRIDISKFTAVPYRYFLVLSRDKYTRPFVFEFVIITNINVRVPILVPYKPGIGGFVGVLSYGAFYSVVGGVKQRPIFFSPNINNNKFGDYNLDFSKAPALIKLHLTFFITGDTFKFCINGSDIFNIIMPPNVYDINNICLFDPLRSESMDNVKYDYYISGVRLTRDLIQSDILNTDYCVYNVMKLKQLFNNSARSNAVSATAIKISTNETIIFKNIHNFCTITLSILTTGVNNLAYVPIISSPGGFEMFFYLNKIFITKISNHLRHVDATNLIAYKVSRAIQIGIVNNGVNNIYISQSIVTTTIRINNFDNIASYDNVPTLNCIIVGKNIFDAYYYYTKPITLYEQNIVYSNFKLSRVPMYSF